MTEKDYNQIKKYITDLTPLVTATLTSLLMTPKILLTKPKTKLKRIIETKGKEKYNKSGSLTSHLACVINAWRLSRGRPRVTQLHDRNHK